MCHGGGRDMIRHDRTGTGKTLDFDIPIFDMIIQYNKKHGHGPFLLRGRNPLAIVMTPTRELARQFEKEFYKSAPELDTLCVYDGSLIQRQLRTLDRDEADQMLNVGDSDQKLADGVMVYFISSETRERPSIIGPLITDTKKVNAGNGLEAAKEAMGKNASEMKRSQEEVNIQTWENHDELELKRMEIWSVANDVIKAARLRFKLPMSTIAGSSCCGKEVIENGNAPTIKKVVEGVETAIAPLTAEEKTQRRLELKARSMHKIRERLLNVSFEKDTLD
ncbi:DEAD-box ATP-dependent RNA helicase 53, mitochondrial-like protein [Tanacetum coccineum]